MEPRSRITAIRDMNTTETIKNNEAETRKEKLAQKNDNTKTVSVTHKTYICIYI